MKKRIYVILSMVLMAITFAGCDIEVGFNKKYKNGSNAKGDVNESISIDGVEKINLDISIADIEVEVTEGNEIKVTRTCKGNNFGELSVSKDGDTINIIEDEVHYSFGGFEQENQLKVQIPELYNGDMFISNGIGDCDIKKLDLNNVNIECGVGDFEVENGNYNKLTLEQGTGDADILLGYCGNIEIRGGVGDLQIQLESVNGDLVLEGGVGDVDIFIPDDSPVYFNTSSGVGECNINAITSGENKYLFDLTTGVGDIDINSR